MAEVVNNGAETPVVDQVAVEQEQANQEALDKFNESQPKGGDDLSNVPKGFRADGTPIEADDNVPEKFKGKSLDDVTKMYQELEKKLGSKEEVKPEVETPSKPDEAKPDNTGFSKYVNEYSETGVVSEDSYKELADRGFPKADVDAYIEGQKALGDNFTSTIQVWIMILSQNIILLYNLVTNRKLNS